MGVSEEWQINILSSISKGRGKNTFRLNNNGKQYSLVPLYAIDEQAYGVYATIRNYKYYADVMTLLNFMQDYPIRSMSQITWVGRGASA